MKPLALFVLALLLLGCSRQARNERFFEELGKYAEQYQSGDPARAIDALKQDIAHLKNAPTSAISRDDRLWWISFSEVRLSMIYGYLGNSEAAEKQMAEAVSHFNDWCAGKGRPEITREQLLAAVVAADQDFSAPWHPKQ